MLNETQDQTIFDESEKITPRNADFWGQAELSMWYAILEKGIGKIPFDPQQHSMDKRVTAIEMQILPIPEQNITDEVRRELIKESREWAGILMPSIKAQGLAVRDLPGKWVHVHLKQTGKTYKNKYGETKEMTMFEVVKVFESEDACKLDYLTRSAEPTDESAKAFSIEQPEAAPVNGNERKTALAFLPALVKNAAAGEKDVEVIKTKLATLIASTPLVNKHFTVDSPEVLQLIAKELTK